MRQQFITILAAVMFLALFNSGFGQDNYNYPNNSYGRPAPFVMTKGMEYGVSVGYGSGTDVYSLSGSSDSYTDDYIGLFNASVSAEYYFSNRWGLKAKLVYDQKGWKDKNYGDDYRLNYLTVPVMANWHFGRTRNWYLNFGPYIGFLVNNSVPDGNGGTYSSSGFNSVDGGLAFGIGVKFPLGNRVKLFIEMDGQAGFANVTPNSADDNNNYNTQLSRGSWNIGINF